MAMPTGTAAISFDQLRTEWGQAQSNVALGSYYKGGAIVKVTDTAPNVPASGAITMDNFHGTVKVATSGPVSDLTMADALSGTAVGMITTTVSFGTNGAITAADRTSGAAAWYSPLTTGIGSSYWLKVVGTGFFGLTSGSIYALSTVRNVSWSIGIGQFINTSATFYIYSNSGGTVQVGTGIISVSLDNTGSSPI
jgi:hypothetical protein